MFSSRAQLKKRTPEDGTDREDYLSLLVDEYINTNSFDAKCQVLANLANFAYDPINYGYIRDVGVLDIFIHIIKNEKNETLLHFATSGICNLCIDPENVQYILNADILNAIAILLKSNHDETIADVITTFIYLFKSSALSLSNYPEIIKDLKILQNSENKIIYNLVSIFLNDIEKSP